MTFQASTNRVLRIDHGQLSGGGSTSHNGWLREMACSFAVSALDCRNVKGRDSPRHLVVFACFRLANLVCTHKMAKHVKGFDTPTS